MLVKLLAVVLMVVSPTLTTACGFITGLFTSEEVSLEYAGEIEFRTPIKNGAVTKIPISFSRGKWIENSGIVFKKVKASRYESEIHITVVTCLASGNNKRQPHEIKLKGLVPGKYQIIYRNPDGSSVRLKQIEI